MSAGNLDSSTVFFSSLRGMHPVLLEGRVLDHEHWRTRVNRLHHGLEHAHHLRPNTHLFVRPRKRAVNAQQQQQQLTNMLIMVELDAVNNNNNNNNNTVEWQVSHTHTHTSRRFRPRRSRWAIWPAIFGSDTFWEPHILDAPPPMVLGNPLPDPTLLARAAVTSQVPPICSLR